MKYVDSMVVLSEVPDEITLAINISNCPIHCKGCHSQYLWEDVGTELTWQVMDKLIKENEGITCVCIMGGDANPYQVNQWLKYIKTKYPQLKTCWYSGRIGRHIYVKLKYLDYIKLGKYDEKRGPLSSPTTNQRFYKVENNKYIDLTYKFQNK